MPRRQTSAEARAARQRNAQRRCNVPGCNKQRRGFSYYCNGHAANDKNHGHPLARRIRHREYEVERRHVVRFLRYHETHKAVVVAKNWAARWLKDAVDGEVVPAADDMKRLAAASVTGADIVEEVLSLWLFSRWHPGSLPDDIRLTKALGTAVLLLGPRETRGTTANGKKRYRNPGSTARRIVGQHIRDTLGVFAFHAMDAIERQMQTREDEKKILRLPFSSCELAASSAPSEDGNTQK